MEIRPILSTLRRHKITAFLIVLEIALTCAIVCNAVFLISQRLDRMDMPSGVAEHQLVQIQLASIGKSADGNARAQEDLSLLRHLPGVKAVSLTNEIPFGNSSWNSGVMLKPDQKQPTLNATNYFGEGLVHTFGLNLVAGRDFNDGDYVRWSDVMAHPDKFAPSVVIITQPLAERLWPGESALGKVIYMGPKQPVRVVGVVQRLVRPSIWDDSMAQWSMMVPIRMSEGYGSSFMLRTAPGQREAVIKAAVSALKKADPKRVVLQKRTWDDVRADFFRSDRSMTGLLVGVCAALLIVTALGIIGLGSFWVAQRRRQIGVRRALGARRVDILRYFQTENFLLVSIGIVLGMALAYGINLLLMQHYELPRLPVTYFPVGALLLWLLGQVAVLGPALRAAAVPPVVATRAA
jgi:putative ABC transport system permease protein